MDTLLNYEMDKLPKDRKTYVQKGSIFFLQPQDQIRKERGNELCEAYKKLQIDQERLYELQHSFQLYREQEKKK